MKTLKVTTKCLHFYPCPHCKQQIQVALPPEDKRIPKGENFWDGLTMCPNKKCGKLHFKRAYSSGKIEILEPDVNETIGSVSV